MSLDLDKDKRRFKRYKCNTKIKISFQGNTYHLQAINYSLKGIGFCFDESLFIKSGSQGHLKIEDLGIDDEGKIIWTKNFDSQLRAGIERKTISGLLRDYPLTDILFDLQQNDMHGILEVRKDPIIKRIFIKDGDVVFATSNKTEDRFIEILLKTGKITTDQYYQLIDISEKTRKSHGASLVELGYLKPDELTSAVRNQVEEITLSLFQWEDAKFIFLEGQLLPEKVIKLKLNTAGIIYSGCKRITNNMYIKNSMPPMNTVLSSYPDSPDTDKNINLDQADKDILQLINGNRSIQDIITLSPYDSQQTLKTLFALICTRIIRIKEPGSPEDTMDNEILKESTIEHDPEFIEKVEALYQRLDSSDYYRILGVEKWATLDKIKKAYYAAAKEFHPDKHKSLPTETLKNKLNAIFAYLTEAYKVLSQSDNRMKYDKCLSTGQMKTKSSNKELAREKYEEGNLVLNRGKYSAAKDLFEQAIYLDNTVPDYHFYLGLALSGDKKYNEAGRIINKALKLDPYNSEYLAELGHIFLQLGFTLRAKGAFEKAVKIDPKNKRATDGLRKVQDFEKK